MNNTSEIKNFIREHSNLFWYTPKEKKKEISEEFLLETILNYGNQKAVKRLFELIGIENAAEIFSIQISNERNNYFAPVKNFFRLYFNRHAQRDFKQ